ncbi:hypothetical protein [Haloechinothrix sp. LS1_15]|uniref:hypothetical protein n=1 Tax=Haloechinothrix sp. LS1_15 TaxID=2652248 RepID=UPI0029449AAA|nr:hypothetical protein [Haloechinothrix sp. LS1_15]MDV6011449.1 hypothetical protein [Haloechinothrix sp. LS1_15]
MPWQHVKQVKRPARERGVPVNDLLSREGVRPRFEHRQQYPVRQDPPVLGEALATVRNGMLGVALLVAVLAWGGPVVYNALLDNPPAVGSEADSDDGTEEADWADDPRSPPTTSPGRETETRVPHGSPPGWQDAEGWQDYVPERYREYLERDPSDGDGG